VKIEIIINNDYTLKMFAVNAEVLYKNYKRLSYEDKRIVDKYIVVGKVDFSDEKASNDIEACSIPLPVFIKTITLNLDGFDSNCKKWVAIINTDEKNAVDNLKETGCILKLKEINTEKRYWTIDTTLGITGIALAIISIGLNIFSKKN
jgi:hypothetical protein